MGHADNEPSHQIPPPEPAASSAAVEADVELRKLESQHSGDMAMWIAEVHAFRGEKDIARSWLDRAYAQKDIFLWLIKGDPLFRNLDGDPRYKAFLRKMNLP
jgi:hypothetical protein